MSKEKSTASQAYVRWVGSPAFLNKTNDLLDKYNALCCAMPITRFAAPKAVWSELEVFALRKKLVKKAELAKATAAKANGPGLRFKSWLFEQVIPPKIIKNERTLDKRLKRAETIIETLRAQIDLAWAKYLRTLGSRKA